MYEQPYWIEGLNVPQVVRRLEERGFHCEEPQQKGEAMSERRCQGTSEEGEAEYGVSITSADPEHVRLITARVSSKAGMPSEDTVASFLAFVASLLYEGRELLQAQQWAMENANTGES